ncbi:hypothetical protein Pmani_002907 [Petrolisthes manimaculis]|uniref:Uncharacterized protein n=1 Tax=Petrolisthes manimaculis TaxID=1843537 RepID=A0AAE1QJJ6_9EUCA|nr:hypothetical protein Pmani_002907 [Petrolisthes manimaculis]
MTNVHFQLTRQRDSRRASSTRATIPLVVYCYWPPRAGASAKVKREERPDKEKWKLYEIRIFSFAETYTKALERAKRAENTSNIDTDPEDIKCRVIKKPVKFIFSEEEEADDTQVLATTDSNP